MYSCFGIMSSFVTATVLVEALAKRLCRVCVPTLEELGAVSSFHAWLIEVAVSLVEILHCVSASAKTGQAALGSSCFFAPSLAVQRTTQRGHGRIPIRNLFMCTLSCIYSSLLSSVPLIFLCALFLPGSHGAACACADIVFCSRHSRHFLLSHLADCKDVLESSLFHFP